MKSYEDPTLQKFTLSLVPVAELRKNEKRIQKRKHFYQKKENESLKVNLISFPHLDRCVLLLELIANQKVESGNSKYGNDDQLVVELLNWFKTKFFKWVLRKKLLVFLRRRDFREISLSLLFRRKRIKKTTFPHFFQFFFFPLSLFSP